MRKLVHFYRWLIWFCLLNLAQTYAETNTIEAGESRFGHIAGTENDIHLYISGGNEWVTILTVSVAGAVFDLLALDGSPLRSNQLFLHAFPLTNAGTYQIVSRVWDQFGEGDYELSLVRHPGLNQPDDGETNRIFAGQSVNGYGRGADLDAYEYVSPGNESVTILAAHVGNGYYNPVFGLLSPEGSLLLSNQNFVHSLRLTNAGTYQIVVWGSDPYYEGDYELSLIRHPGPNQPDDGETNRIFAGQSVNGYGRGADLDAYEYVSPGNESVTILAAHVGNGYYNPVFGLLSPEGSLLLSNQNFVHSLRLTNAGTYQIVVWGSDRYYEGDYELSLIRRPGPNQPDDGETNRISAGQTISGNGGWADLDAYEFDAIAGDALSARVRRIDGGATFSPVFDIHGPGGLILSGTNWLDRLCVTRTGRYQIVCRESDAYDTGSYSLFFQLSPGPLPDSVPPEFLQICQCSNLISIRWSTNATGFRLESAEELFSPVTSISWTSMPTPYSTFERLHFVTNAADLPKMFFRLAKP